MPPRPRQRNGINPPERPIERPPSEFEAPPEIARSLEGVKEAMTELFSSAPVDHLSFTISDPQILSWFKRCVAWEEKARQVLEMKTSAALTNITSRIAYLENLEVTSRRSLSYANDALASCREDLQGTPPVQPGERAQPAPPVDVPTWLKRALIFIGILYGLTVDFVNFRGLLELLYNTLSEVESDILASGISAIAAICSVVLGSAVGRLRRDKDRWERIRIAFSAAVLITLVLTTFVIRNSAPGNLPTPTLPGIPSDLISNGGGHTRLLTAAFFSVVLIATSWITVEESRVIARFSPYFSAKREVSKLSKRVQAIAEELAYVGGLRREWFAYQRLCVIHRDTEILAHAGQSDRLFADARVMTATRVKDPIVTDAVAHAPKINLDSDVPKLSPRFQDWGVYDESKPAA
jgi:hypothetical protein